MSRITLSPDAPRRDDDPFDDAFLRKLEYLHIVSRKVFAGRTRAERRAKRIGSGIEFADHRDYQPGDDVRYVDWAIFGRLERLLLRLFEEEEDLSIYILLDTSASMATGADAGAPAKIDFGKRVAAALCYLGLANLDRVSILQFASALSAGGAPARGRARIFGILDTLRAIEAGETTALAESLATLAKQRRRPGLVAVISDFYDRGFAEGLNVLRYHRFEPYAIQVLARADLLPDAIGDVEIVDAETGEARPVRLTPRVLAEYRAAHAAHLAAIEAHCRRAGVPLFRTETHVPFEDLILRVFRAGGFLR